MIISSGHSGTSGCQISKSFQHIKDTYINNVCCWQQLPCSSFAKVKFCSKWSVSLLIFRWSERHFSPPRRVLRTHRSRSVCKGVGSRGILVRLYAGFLHFSSSVCATYSKRQFQGAMVWFGVVLHSTDCPPKYCVQFDWDRQQYELPKGGAELRRCRPSTGALDTSPFTTARWELWEEAKVWLGWRK